MIELQIGPRVWTGWKEVNISGGLSQLSHQFTVKVGGRSDKEPIAFKHAAVMPRRIKLYDACVVRIGDEPVVTGQIEGLDPFISADERSLTVQGRSRAGLIVGASSLVPGGQFKGYTIEGIARAVLEPFDLKLEVDAPVGAVFPRVQLQPGELVISLLQRLGRLRGVVFIDKADGNLQMTRASTQRGGSIAEGDEGLLSFRPGLSASNAFSHYVVRGQTAGNDQLFGETAASGQARLRNEAVPLYRPKVLIADASSSVADMRERAAWAMAVDNASMQSIQVDWKGWRNSDGKLWQSNRLVSFAAPSMAIKRDFLIETVTRTFSEGRGTRTGLRLVSPEAYTPEPVIERLSDGGDAQWGFVKSIKDE